MGCRPNWKPQIGDTACVTKHRYIAMDLQDALEAKWAAGVREHRRKGESSFVGDPCEELYQEFLDAINIVSVLEDSGVEMPGFRTTLKNMALTVQARERELRKRIM